MAVVSCAVGRINCVLSRNNRRENVRTTAKEHAQGRDDLETRQSHVKSTSRKFDLSVAGAREAGARETSYDGH